MTRVIPPIVHVDRTPKGRLLAFFADGRVAGRSTEPDAEWVAIDHIDYNALWPEPAPVADAPTVRYGTPAIVMPEGMTSFPWNCECPDSPPSYIPHYIDECPACGAVNPARRPTPTP